MSRMGNRWLGWMLCSLCVLASHEPRVLADRTPPPRPSIVVQHHCPLGSFGSPVQHCVAGLKDHLLHRFLLLGGEGRKDVIGHLPRPEFPSDTAPQPREVTRS